MYIEVFYKQQRRYSTLGYRSPAEVEPRGGPQSHNQVSTELREK